MSPWRAGHLAYVINAPRSDQPFDRGGAQTHGTGRWPPSFRGEPRVGMPAICGGCKAISDSRSEPTIQDASFSYVCETQRLGTARVIQSRVGERDFRSNSHENSVWCPRTSCPGLPPPRLPSSPNGGRSGFPNGARDETASPPCVTPRPGDKGCGIADNSLQYTTHAVAGMGLSGSCGRKGRREPAGSRRGRAAGLGSGPGRSGKR
jgi:hypothetical protein